ncbi:MAG: hypothetical protein AAF629_32300 [Chloroflexota bacterium]
MDLLQTSYEILHLVPQIFGQPYHPVLQTNLGRPAKIRHRIPHTLAHAQIVKHPSDKRLTGITIHFSHGSKKRIRQVLQRLGYKVPNTSVIERRNGTARPMAATQTRRTLAFAKCPETNLAKYTVYDWARPHRSLRHRLPEPQGRKLYQPRISAMTLGLAHHIFLSVIYPFLKFSLDLTEKSHLSINLSILR